MTNELPRADGGRVTVVVATRNRCEELARSLTHHEAPVILVDNGSSDGTPAMVRERFPHVRVVELGENHGAVARNHGVRLATTPYVAFADDDSWWAPGALALAADTFDAWPRLALLAARIHVGPEERLDPVCEEMAGSPLGTPADLPGPGLLGFVACGAVVRRTAFLAAGGFDDVVVFLGEEERLALDLASTGWGLSYVDSVVAHHHPSPVRDVGARRVRATRNRILTDLMRRPWPVVARSVRAGLLDGAVGRAGTLQAFRAAPAALRARRRIPDDVEVARRLLDGGTVPADAR